MNVVGYVRISRDEDRENYSSITTQQDIINEYAAKRGWNIKKMYIDDNFSGYTLQRPAFNELLRNIEDGSVDVILSKDLSRIGRNNGQVLVLIDRLKKKEKRLILISEGSGGYDILDDNDDIIGIKTWYNEMYVKDISRKIRVNMSLKQKKGELIMGNHYGYKKIRNNNKFELTADENIRPVIELIFNCYVNGLGYKKICDILNKKGYPTPSEYLQKMHADKGRAFRNTVTLRWQTHMIQRIIKDDIYIGVLRTKKKHSKLIKGKQEPVCKDEQYVFKNHHPPLISEAVFNLAQQLNQKKQVINYRGSSKYNYIFSGFVVCKDCGSSAGGKNIKKKAGNKRIYECLMYQKYGLKYCCSHAVSEEKILFYFKEFLKDVRASYESYLESLSIDKNKKNTSQNPDKIIKELNILKDELKLLYSEKIRDLMKETDIEYKRIIEHSYEALENDKKKQISLLAKKAEDFHDKNTNAIEKNLKTSLNIFDDIINCEAPTREMLEMILEKIIIYKDRSLEFKLLVSIDKLIHDKL